MIGKRINTETKEQREASKKAIDEQIRKNKELPTRF